MPELLHNKPNFSLADATRIAADQYGKSGDVTELASERDQNFLVRHSQETAWVLKIANADTPEASIDLQEAMTAHLNSKFEALAFPCCLPRLNSNERLRIPSSTGSEHTCRLVPFKEGIVWAEYSPHGPNLWKRLGSLIGSMTRGLQDFTHPGAHRNLQWDLQRCHAVVDKGLSKVANETDRSLIRKVSTNYHEIIQPIHQELRQSVLHGDANDYNIVINPNIGGHQIDLSLIDFGDAVHSATVNDLAIALAYALFEVPDPVTTATHIVSAYHAEYPLNEDELKVLPSLVMMRLCTSITQAAVNLEQHPDNAYLSVSVRSARSLLARLDALPKSLLHYALRQTCGLPAHPQSAKLATWIDSARPQAIVDCSFAPKDIAVLDLSVGSPLSLSADSPQAVDRATRKIADQLFSAGASVGIGRYNEPRFCYQGAQFACENGNARTIHLGIDLFLEPGFPVKVPFPGRICGVKDNDQAEDYGPTVIVEHTVNDDNLTFYTLYGHLGRDSISSHVIGKEVQAGETIGCIGIPFENGGWPPHLHFQVMMDLLGNTENFPGVADADHRELWLDLCPNPGPFFGLPRESIDASQITASDLLSRRKSIISPSLSLSYETPLHFVQGSGQYLFDPNGRRYLDCVNNVCHVGHSHPHVVNRISEQATLLNTNTRYLHSHLIEYAEKLTALFPSPLDACFFVCSGSEANDLALRLARNVTKSKEIVVIDGAYHGNLTSTVEISPYKYKGPGGFTPPEYVHEIATPDPYRGPFRSPSPSLTHDYVQELETLLERLKTEAKPAPNFIAESILSCAGQIVLPDNYLRRCYEAIHQAGGLCIADEVQVGFGRAGSHFWGFETQEVIPDIVTLGKPIGNGHPIGAVITSRAIADAFNNGMEYFNTFGGNPVSCAAGLGVLEVMEDEALQSHAKIVGSELLSGLKELQQRYPIIGNVRGQGLFIGIELVSNAETRRPSAAIAKYVVERMKQARILLSTDGPKHNVIKIKPPLPISKEDCQQVLTILAHVLNETPLERIRRAEASHPAS